MKKPFRLFLGLMFGVLLSTVFDVQAQEPMESFTLENPISVSYLKNHLAKASPKLILTPQAEKAIKQKLNSDPLVQSYFKYLKNRAAQILEEPLLKRELEGFRLLAVSRKMVERMGVLGMVYRIEKNPEILKRIDAELNTVCAFQDWNPQHFLDVAEMSFGVALATDWVGAFLPKETVKLAKTSLIEKGIIPSFNEDGPRMTWINGKNNWNSVCHGGMIAASLAIADVDPELASKTISRALEKLTNSLKEYGPDGVYPEGPSYWGYGTSYSVIASTVLTTALGKDFGISKSPGFMESANFYLQSIAPSGEVFNFADSDGRNNGSGSVLLAWFAEKTGDELYFDKTFLENPEDLGRFAGPGLVWFSSYKPVKSSKMASLWYGRGPNPVAFLRGGEKDKDNFYLAVKGGSASNSHGNMDAGTFILELNDVRWVIDPGNQPYYPLNRIGFNLAGGCQDCERWTLLTKGNQGHSTITVNNARHKVSGRAPITEFKKGEMPEVTIDMSTIFEGHLQSLQRRFVKESSQSILIEDRFELNDSTRNITWALMTKADVQLLKNGALLKQDGNELKINILAPENLEISIISLDPPPMEIDKTINDLKRLEIRVPAYVYSKNKGIIQVRLSAENK